MGKMEGGGGKGEDRGIGLKREGVKLNSRSC